MKIKLIADNVYNNLFSIGIYIHVHLSFYVLQKNFNNRSNSITRLQLQKAIN